MPETMQPRSTPCGSCPYRQDCPSGVWHDSEYAKLIEYDRDTGSQPQGVFMCHSDNDRITICRGWLDVHTKWDLLALRLAASLGRVLRGIFDLPKCDVPTFASGTQAAEHGMTDIDDPSPEAQVFIDKLANRKQITKATK